MMTERHRRGIAHAPAQQPNLRALHAPGHVSNVPDRAARRLARAIHFAESTCVAVSWSAQERAEMFYNQHGLSAALTEAARLEALQLPDADP